MVPDDTVTDTNRIDRRDAMKAALGGAAAAAALSAPSISGFSLAPNFAAAASQCPPGSTVTASPASFSRTGAICGLTACWGFFPSCTIGIGTCTNQSLGTMTVNAAANQYSDPTFAVTVGGQVHNNNGRVIVTVANFNSNLPFSSCAINVTGTCQSGTFAVTNISSGITGATTTVTANGTYTGQVRCSGTPISNITGTITVAATCICS